MMFFIFLTLLFSSLADSHDAVIAVFNLSEKDGKVFLDVSFDIDDFSAMNTIKSSSINQEINTYIHQTTTWQLNAQKTELSLLKIQKENEHYRVKYELKNVPKIIKSISVQNNFFLHIEDHSNIIMLDLNDRFRDFRMHEGRKEILVNY